MPGRQCTRLPEGITMMPPGSELGVLLAGIDVVSLGPAELPRYLVAEQRQKNHQDARRLLALRECALGDSSAPGGRRPVLDEYAAEEPRACLSISMTAAWRDIFFADALVERVPRVLAAMLAGDLDDKRAQAFVELTEHLSAEHTARLLDELLGDARESPVAELRRRLERCARALDPEWAARRVAKTVRQRRVRARLNDGGAVNISGLDLPVGKAVDRVNGIVDLATMCQAQGHPGRLDTIRADVLLALLDVDLRALPVADFVAVIAAEGGADAAREAAEDAEDADPQDAPEAADRQEAGRQEAPGRVRFSDPTDSESPRHDSCDASAGSDDPAGAHGLPDDDLHDGDDQGGDGPADHRPGREATNGPGGDEDEQAGAADGQGLKGSRRGRFRMTVALSTLLELDEMPAELECWGPRGPIIAMQAREFAAVHARGLWQVAITAADDSLFAALVTRHRPTTYRLAPDGGGTADNAMVTLTVTAEALDSLDPAEHPEWARVITDLQHQLAAWRRALRDEELAVEAETEARAAEATAAAARQTDSGACAVDSDRRPTDGQPVLPAPGGGFFRECPDTAAAPRRAAEHRRRIALASLRRFPTTALVRWVQLRDRRCSFPPCRTPAWLCDIDHTIDWALGGISVHDNLGPGCAHDHAAKHRGGWSVRQVEPGHFIWTSRTGNDYPSPPRPITPRLPDPDPPPEGQRSSAEPDEYAGDAPIWINDPFPGPRPPRRRRGWAPEDGPPPRGGRGRSPADGPPPTGTGPPTRGGPPTSTGPPDEFDGPPPF